MMLCARLTAALTLCLVARGAVAQQAPAAPRAWLTLRLNGAVERVEIRPVRDFVVSSRALSICTARYWRTCQVFLPRGEYALVAHSGELATTTDSFYLGRDTSMEVRGRARRSPAVTPLLVGSLVGMGIGLALLCAQVTNSMGEASAQHVDFMVPAGVFFGAGAALGVTGLVLNDQRRLDLYTDADGFGRRETPRAVARASPVGLGLRGVF